MNRGNLPWTGLEPNQTMTRMEQVGAIKERISSEDLCEGLPPPIKEMLDVAKSMEFQERPDYDGLKRSFVLWMKDRGPAQIQ